MRHKLTTRKASSAFEKKNMKQNSKLISENKNALLEKRGVKATSLIGKVLVCDTFIDYLCVCRTLRI